MIKAGIPVECGRDGLEVHICRRVCQLLSEHFRMPLQLDIVPMDNKPRLLEECDTTTRLLFAGGCERCSGRLERQSPDDLNGKDDGVNIRCYNSAIQIYL